PFSILSVNHVRMFLMGCYLLTEVSGVWTRGTCVILYTEFNCKGFEVMMRPGTLSHENLATLGFDSLAKSMAPCEIRPEEKGIEPSGGVDQKSDLMSLPLLICALLTLVNFCFTVVTIRRSPNSIKSAASYFPLPPTPPCHENIYGVIEN
ncbi:hypothetical protein PFISCL1PPCAC_17134, partial [Pristionchus fissidentatus]